MSFPLELKKMGLHQEMPELFVPEPQAVREKYLQGGIGFPYWSQVWPSALALSEFLLEHRHYIENKSLVELGAGLGLPSLVAARYANKVVCSDYLPEAVEIIGQSAAHHGYTNFTAALIDWHSLPKDLKADVLLLSDVNYTPASFGAQQQLIHRFLEAGTTVILSTPQRLMAKEFLMPLLPWCKEKKGPVRQQWRKAGDNNRTGACLVRYRIKPCLFFI